MINPVFNPLELWFYFFMTRVFERVLASAWVDRAFHLLFLIGAIALVRDTASQGQDFAVFWKAARLTFEGQPVYSVARDGAMVFKYPPWIVPFFFPLALFPLAWAKWIWGALQVASIFYVSKRLVQAGLKPRLVYLSVMIFWGIWAVHALDGQVNIVILALLFFFLDPHDPLESGVVFRWTGVLAALSTKIFTVFGLGAYLSKENFKKIIRPTLISGAILAVFSLPAMLGAIEPTPSGLMQSWIEAAGSGGTEFGGSKVRGVDNQGLPAFFLRLLGAPANQSHYDLIAFIVLAILFGGLWWRVSQKLSVDERWVGWMGLIPVVHPLSWFHVFAFSYPLAAYALDRAYGEKNWIRFGMALMGVILIAAVTEKTLGEWGYELELVSIKSWGVILCLISLIKKPAK